MALKKITQHGTITAYNARGCRCQTCRDAWAQYMRNYKRNRFGVRERQSFYEGAEDSAMPVRLTSVGKQILDAAVARTGRRRNDVIERLLRMYGVEMESTSMSGTVTAEARV